MDNLERLSKLVKDYHKSYHNWSQEEIADFRSKISFVLFYLTEEDFLTYLEAHTEASTNLEKIKAEVYWEYYEDNGATAANTLYKKDETYLEAYKKEKSTKDDLKLINRIYDQANHILHSISSRI